MLRAACGSAIQAGHAGHPARGTATHDQVRVMTPEAAIAAGRRLSGDRTRDHRARPIRCGLARHQRRNRSACMKITMIGAGYVGLVTGACFAEVGNDVLCVDVDAAQDRDPAARRRTDPRAGIAGDDRAQRARRGACASPPMSTPRSRTACCSSSRSARRPTRTARPTCATSSPRPQHRRARMTEFKVIVDKSTVPVGTADRVRETIAAALAQRDVDDSIRGRVESGISEGRRGGRGLHAPGSRRHRRRRRARDRACCATVYAPFQRNHERLLVMDVRSAELTKYAANAMLATRISFMNELANLADELGADVEHVRQGIGSDPRIGYRLPVPGRRATAAPAFPRTSRRCRRPRGSTASPLRDPRRGRGGQRRAEIAAGRQRSLRASGDDLQRQGICALGPGVQAEHRRHARGAVARDRRGARGARRPRRCLRSDRDRRSQARLSAHAGAELRAVADGRR